MGYVPIQRFVQLAAQLVTLATVVAATCSVTAGEASPQEKLAFFETHIRPVLIQHCYECHSVNAKNVRGELLLDSREAIRAGGESGPAVVPGDPADSLLLSALRHESFEMPPEAKLPSEVARNFEKWIRDGAFDPREGGTTVERRQIDLAVGREFWSFRPVVKPSPPAIKTTEWPRTIIDQFILGRIESTNGGDGQPELHPATKAAPATLLRRAKFDLLGLPPTVNEIQEFLDDPTPLAFEKQVDAWLNSAQFGVRWGRHWMDVARFAESSGGGRSLMFPHAWRFRDYVIETFNDDVPFDQFIREQIAGDLLPATDDAARDRNITGTGFLTLGPTNYELQDKDLLELEIIDEQIDTIGRAFLGLTLGCVRCHDHKFDPIPMTDYYGLAGIMASTESVVHSNVSKYFVQPIRTDPAHDEIARADERIAALTAQLDHQKKSLKESQIRISTLTNMDEFVLDDDQASLTGKWKKSTHVPNFVGEHYLAADSNDATATFEFEGDVPGLLFISYSAGSNRPKSLPITIFHKNDHTKVTIDQTAPPANGQYALLGQFEAPNKVTIKASDVSQGVVIVDAIRFVPIPANNDVVSRQQFEKAFSTTKKLRARVTKTKSLLAQAKKKRPRKPVAMAVRDRTTTGDTTLRIRGEIRNPGPLVPRQFVSVASPAATTDGRPANLNLGSHTSGRRELAEWIASPRNPLTSRVIVNRVWHHLMGEGLVRTPDNFGLMGQPPTHPALLDYLAADFAETSWSIKQLVRTIMVSQVYQLDSRGTEALLRTDPANRLFARTNRRRLDAESLRDSMLQISGQLEEFAGGRTIRKLAEYDLDYEFDTRKRSVYVPRFRNSVLDIFQNFDVANPNIATGKRAVSVLSTQALYMMNSPFVNEQALLAAERLLKNTNSHEARLEMAYLRTVGRPPTPSERSVLKTIVGDGSAATIDDWTEVFHLLFGSIDFRYVH